jgi:hypothetical protein
VRAHPADLGITEASFASCLLGLGAYARREGLDQGIADFVDLTQAHVDDAWAFVTSLPRRD